MTTPYRAALAAFVLCLLTSRGSAADWEPTTADLVKVEKPGYGGLCGVIVDHASGDVYIDLSEKGLYRSTDQGKTWKKHGPIIKGRTEWPGCLLLDPTGKTRKLVMALVYGASIGVAADAGDEWQFMDKKSVHVDWCAVDWTDPGLKFVLALKHESGGLLLASHDGGKTFDELGKGYGPAWIFDEKTAVVAELKTKERARPRLLRTTDAGKTFEGVGEYNATALPKWRDGRLYWLVEEALLSSTDQGKTWKKMSDVKGGRYGPVFGQDAKQLFVLTGDGIVESTDGGSTWGKPIAVPKELKGVSALTWIEYDPKNDVLYVMKMGSDLYRLARGK
jgi:BNR/Asp-box repeat